MRKKGSILLICVIFCLSALHAEPKQLKLGIGNDIWTFGISQNNDDQLSFSSRVDYADTDFDLTLSVDAITNRGWKLDWSSSELISGRYDTIYLDFELNTLSYDKNGFYFSFKPLLGFSLAGNLGLDRVQNFLHQNTSIPQVDIPYETGYVFSPRLGGELLIGPGFSIGSNSSSFKAFAGISAVSSLLFETEASAYIRSTIVSRGKTTASLTLGYRYVIPHTEWVTQSLYDSFSSGWFLGFNLNLGLLSLDYRSNLENKIGYCTYSIDVLSFLQDSSFRKPDFNYSIMFSMVLNKTYHEAEIYKEILDTNISLGLATRYFSADPIPCEHRKLTSSSSYYGIISYAFDYGYLSSWLVPYVSVGLGVTDFSMITYFNTDESADRPFDKESDILFSFDIAAGITLFPPHLLDLDNASYSLRLKGGVIYYSDPGIAKRYLLLPSEKNIVVFPYFSIGVNIAIDL